MPIIVAGAIISHATSVPFGKNKPNVSYLWLVDLIGNVLSCRILLWLLAELFSCPTQIPSKLSPNIGLKPSKSLPILASKKVTITKTYKTWIRKSLKMVLSLSRGLGVRGYILTLFFLDLLIFCKSRPYLCHILLSPEGTPVDQVTAPYGSEQKVIKNQFWSLALA